MRWTPIATAALACALTAPAAAEEPLVGATRETAGVHPVTCVFNHYPAEKLRRIATASDADIEQLLEGTLFTDSEMVAAFTACRVRPELPGIAVALQAYQYEYGAGHWLKRRLGKTDAEFEAGYTAVSGFVQSLPGDFTNPSYLAALQAGAYHLLIALGVSEQDAHDRQLAHFAYVYLVGREARQDLEPTV